MSFTDVMYGNLVQVNNQFQNNLGQNAAMNQGQQAAMAQQQQAAAAQQAQLAALYGAQGFGGQDGSVCRRWVPPPVATPEASAATAAIRMSPVGGYNSIDQNDPGNIALYYQIMGIPAGRGWWRLYTTNAAISDAAAAVTGGPASRLVSLFQSTQRAAKPLRQQQRRACDLPRRRYQFQRPQYRAVLSAHGYGRRHPRRRHPAHKRRSAMIPRRCTRTPWGILAVA